MPDLYISQVLNKKAENNHLTDDEIAFYINELVEGRVGTAQIGAFLMAVYTRGMTEDETVSLTSAMVNHSEKLRWNDKPWAKYVVDKHSTGGVGDKTSHILAPVIAACGGKVPMISGRGLGITGGTIDKLESVDGYSPNCSPEKLENLINDPGFFIVGQTENLVPADRLLYKYRDVTGTVASIPLITGSILSKKICEGLSGLVLDIKLGAGALYKDIEDVRKLARSMIDVGKKMDLKVTVVVSSMDFPLGECAGNALEMAEVFSILSGKHFQERLKDLVLTLGSHMLSATSIESKAEKAANMMLEKIENGKARETMRKMLFGQGVSYELAETLCSPPPEGTPDAIDYYLEKMGKMANAKTPIASTRGGFISAIDARAVGEVVWRLGAGRDKPEDAIDYTVGVRILKHVGDTVKKDEAWCIVYHKESKLDSKLKTMMNAAITVSEDTTKIPDVVVEIIN